MGWHELYLRFVEEKEKRINIYVQGAVFETQIQNFRGQLEIAPTNPFVINDLKRLMGKYDQWVKERDDENARFITLIDELTLRFKDSSEFNEIMKTVSVKPFGGYDVKEPTKEDFRDREAWIKWIEQANASKNEFLDHKLKQPLQKLATYLQKNLK
jgi:hypothetical protein